jgi:hypothetical protein
LTDDEVRDFIGLYERHMARGEAELLPMAARLLRRMPNWTASDCRCVTPRRLRTRTALGPPPPDTVRQAPSLNLQGAVMSQPHLHLSPDAIYPFDARGVAKRFRHAAIFGALDSLQPGETMRFANDHDPLPLLSQIAQRMATGSACNTASASLAPSSSTSACTEPLAHSRALHLGRDDAFRSRAAPSFP